MANMRSSLCMLALTLVLLATFFESCMANKEIDTQKSWSWGRGWDRDGRRWGRSWGRSRGWGRGRSWDWGRGASVPPPPPPPTPSTYNYSRGGSGCPSSQTNITRGSNKIVVGGSNNWNFGYNYTEWALKNGPFYLNDVLVFKYDAPLNNTLPGHSVYLLPDFWSYLKCDLSRAKRVASTTEGGGKGFEFKLTKWQPHYFACGEHDGIHCNLGMMKFFVTPIFRYSN